METRNIVFSRSIVMANTEGLNEIYSDIYKTYKNPRLLAGLLGVYRMIMLILLLLPFALCMNKHNFIILTENQIFISILWGLVNIILVIFCFILVWVLYNLLLTG